jgi:hypothetical protein
MKTVRMLAIFTLGICAFTVTANAQSVTGNFTLPHEVHWGRTVLPPGDYSITVESSSKPAFIQSASGEEHMFTTTPTIGDKEKVAAGLLITVNGNERTVRALNLPQYGVSLIYKPFTKAEREATAQAETVPVIVAKK